MQDKTEDKPGASPEDACSHGHVGYCGSCWAEQAPKCRHGHPGACGFCIAAVGRELELASARERLSKLSGLHPDRKLADHLDALATRPGHEEVRRERAELRVTLVEALGPLPTDHPHMLGQLRVRLADASKWEAMCDKASELTMEARAEAKRWRARCPVTAEDVKAAGVTRGKAQAFYDHLGDGVIVEWDAIGQRATLANYVNASAAYLRRPAFDILDEMAAQEAP